jgi:hypothetical protein
MGSLASLRNLRNNYKDAFREGFSAEFPTSNKETSFHKRFVAIVGDELLQAKLLLYLKETKIGLLALFTVFDYMPSRDHLKKLKGDTLREEARDVMQRLSIQEASPDATWAAEKLKKQQVKANQRADAQKSSPSPSASASPAQAPGQPSTPRSGRSTADAIIHKFGDNTKDLLVHLDILGTTGRVEVFGQLHKRKSPVLQLVLAQRMVRRRLDMDA